MEAPLHDPVCGMPVEESSAYEASIGDRRLRFCSALCRDRFVARPQTYLARASAVDQADGTRRIAYFSMEIALTPRAPTYSGGLGILAGDVLRSFADLRVPAVAITLVHRRGYFRQSLSFTGRQAETPDDWRPELVTVRAPAHVAVDIEGRHVRLGAWRYDVVGVDGHVVPVLLLDTDLPENAPEDRRLTDALYGGDDRYRLAQEIVLGVGGVRLLRALGFSGITRFHMNEGHAALAAIELLREGGGGDADFANVREQCVFTTHTPVPAGHDQFDYGLVHAVLGARDPILRMLGGEERLNMTRLALNASHYVNGVAQTHQQVSARMFPGYDVQTVTNGVHSATWTSEPFQELFDRYAVGWRSDPATLRHAARIPDDEIWNAHAKAKQRLLAEVRARTGRILSVDALTLGVARRATAYKRLDLVLSDPERLRALATRAPLQFLFAGKAHPRDEEGKRTIERIVGVSRALGDAVPVVFLEGYDWELARLLVAGSDVWLNTPLPPLEASGTSGMKAAHNGVPSLSTLDGWWAEGHIEGITGWSIGDGGATSQAVEASVRDAHELYSKLGDVIAPLFTGDRAGWARVMRQTIALNAAFFNTHRMVQQYALNAYR